jgi:thiamine pyrophosphate-dependent acetolactate synthase large subunit-like protein
MRGEFVMKRIDVIRAMAEFITKEDLLVTSIGATNDDWWNYQPADNTFYCTILGSISTTALGMAISLPHRRIIAIESDGSVLMNTGAMCTLGAERPPNLTVVVMDNGIYENIGGPPTLTSRNTDLAKMAAGAGCLNAVTAHSVSEFRSSLAQVLDDGEMGYIVAKIEPGRHRWKPEERKPGDGIEDKYRFIRYVEKLEGIEIHANPLHR